MAEQARDARFAEVLDAFRTATNIAVGTGPEGLYDLLDAVENLIHPDFEGDEGCVHAALDAYRAFRIRDEARAEDKAAEDAVEEACDTLPAQITLDGVTYSLTPLDEA